MKVLLEVLLPKLLPAKVESLIIPHNGKSDLKRSIPVKLRGWQSPRDKFIIVHDQDSNDCMKLKADLKLLCENNNAKNELRNLIPTYQPIDGARKIAACMDVNRNTSHSFNVFVNGIKNVSCN